MGYGYFLGSIAFVDKNPDDNQFGYTNIEVINIFKNNLQVKKVYEMF